MEKLEECISWLVGKVAEILEVSAESVSNYTRDNDVREILKAFFIMASCKTLFWTYQSTDDDSDEQKIRTPRLSLNVVAQIHIRGRCAYFIRTSNGAISVHKLEDEITYGRVDGEQYGSDKLLISMQRFVQEAALPAFAGQRSWGVLTPKSSEAAVPQKAPATYKSLTLSAFKPPPQVLEFMESVQKAVSGMSEAVECLRDNITLRPPATLKHYGIENKPTSYMRAASTSEVVVDCERTI